MMHFKNEFADLYISNMQSTGGDHAMLILFYTRIGGSPNYINSSFLKFQNKSGRFYLLESFPNLLNLFHISYSINGGNYAIYK